MNLVLVVDDLVEYKAEWLVSVCEWLEKGAAKMLRKPAPA